MVQWQADFLKGHDRVAGLSVFMGYRPAFTSAWRRRRSSPCRASASRLLASTRMKASRHASFSQRNGVWTVVRGIQARSRSVSALPTITRCISTSSGRPHGFPRGKSVKTKRATPHSSTMSRAQPMTAVDRPLASKWRDTRLTVWWQTGQSPARSTASRSSSRHHSRIRGAACSIVLLWL